LNEIVLAVPNTIGGGPTLSVDSDKFRGTFISFFDWDQLAQRDYGLLQIEIKRLDEHPEVVGHHALVEFNKCALLFDDGQL
jgi:hypothetical protein